MCFAKSKIKTNSKFKKGQIRFNRKHGHYGHIKAIFATKNGIIVTSVFFSSKPKDGQRNNVPLNKKLIINGVENSYFFTRVRSYPAVTYSKKYIQNGLSKVDIEKSDTIYELYLERKKRPTPR